ncbi:MAG: PAS domain S-box protein [Candidatus Omnitrophota bacterium]
MNDPERKIKMLLVEDDEDFSAALVSRLMKKDFEVIRVSSAEEAIEKLKDTKYEVVVTDIKLPGMDGTELLAKIREFDKNIPVILVTGYASLDTAKTAVKLDAADYLLKPLESLDELLNPVYKAVYSYKLTLENKDLLSSLREKINELKISERKYRGLFELASDMIFIIDNDGVITSANKRVEEVTKYAKNDLIGKPAKDLITPVEEGIHGEKYGEILAGKSRHIVDVKVMTKEGEVRLGEMGMRPIKEENQVAGIQCIVRDITERKEAEAKIRYAAEEWRATFDSITDMVSIIDKDNKLARVNKAFADLYGLERDDIMAKGGVESDPDLIGGGIFATHLNVLAEGKPVTNEVFDTKRNMFLEVSTSPVFNGSDGVIGTVNIIKDITGRKEIEKAQRLAQLGRMVADVAHQVNNPLMVISGRAQLSLMEPLESEEVKTNLDLIYKQCHIAKNIVSRILKFSRPSAEEFKKVNINENIEEIVAIVEKQFNLCDIEIKRQFAPGLPEIMLDEKQMQEVFMNLFTNASDAMPSGGILSITTKLEDKYVKIEIKDTGKGIEPQNLKGVFEPFFTTKKKGTGLGLPFSYSIVQMHKGKMELDSSPGKGTTIVISLPVEVKEG